MQPMRRALIVIGTVLLTACGNGEVVEVPNDIPVDVVPENVPTYVTDSVPLPATKALLFFAKEHDPFSRKNEALVRQFYGSGAAKLSTFRIDFSSATGARLKYGVLVEDTFVLLGQNGERITSILHPTTQELQSLLSGTAP